MLNWIKKLIYIVKNYDNNLRSAHARIDEMQKIIRDRTEVSADINYSGAGNHIIVVGKYGGVDHVQCFTIDSRQFEQTIDQLRELQKYAKIARMDVPPTFRANVLRCL